MREINLFDFKILELDTLKELKGLSLKKYDIVNVFSKIDSGFWRPQKIKWRLELTGNNDPPVLRNATP